MKYMDGREKMARVTQGILCRITYGRVYLLIIMILIFLKPSYSASYYVIPDEIKITNDQIRMMVENSVLKLKDSPETDKIRSIAITHIDNATREHLRMSYIESQLSLKLMNLTDFRVIDRKQTELILSEFDLSLSGAVASDTIKEAGKLLGVDAFLAGRVTSFTQERFSEENMTYSLVLQLTDVNTGQVIWGNEEIIFNKISTGARNMLYLGCLGSLVTLLVLALLAGSAE